MGLGPLAGVGDQLPAAAPQLRHDPADPVGVAGVRPAPPGGGGGRAGAQRRRPPRPVRRRPADGRPRGDAPGPRHGDDRGTDRGQPGGRRPMKIEAWIFGLATVFFLIVSPAYWLITKDWTGTSALTMTTLLVAMITLYLGFH